jgi:hypothetical protein
MKRRGLQRGVRLLRSRFDVPPPDSTAESETRPSDLVALDVRSAQRIVNRLIPETEVFASISRTKLKCGHLTTERDLVIWFASPE